jgi:hypothetical protein
LAPQAGAAARKNPHCRGAASALRRETHSVMALIRSLFWFALFLAATFGFTVLFEHGTTDYFANAKKEKEYLMKMAGMGVAKKADDSDKLPR